MGRSVKELIFMLQKKNKQCVLSKTKTKKKKHKYVTMKCRDKKYDTKQKRAETWLQERQLWVGGWGTGHKLLFL